MILDRISEPGDLRALTYPQLDQLADEIRDFIVDTVARTAGHLGSNLGAVELSIAVHRVFESPRDIIVWDTGHQAYVHKLLTGRMARFDSLRQRGGLSGYPARDESPHDVVENSHASTSLSWTHGLTTALRLRGDTTRKVVAIIGDGSMTGGMAYEGLNNIGHSGQPCVIILNDNGRSYAPTIGTLTKNIVRLRMDQRYVSSRNRIERLLDRLPFGSLMNRSMRSAAAGAREFFEPPAFFETLGVRYIGPIDGHDIAAVEQALRHASTHNGPIVVHVLTRKGQGYAPAERDDEKHLHDTGTFDPSTGASVAKPSTPDFTSAFRRSILAAGERDPNVVTITAAMPGSTGLLPFAERFPDRCIDVGIAEQHAVTAAAGMATGGLRPVVALYATFLTRAIDQVAYDVALHDLPVVFCLDRAGITGPDGASHHGILDLALLSRVPNMTILAPSCFDEVDVMLRAALAQSTGPVAIRWSRGAAPVSPTGDVGTGFEARRLRTGAHVCLLAVGPLVWEAMGAAERLAEVGVECTVWDPRAVRPLDPAMVDDASRHDLVFTIEDAVVEGGFGSAVSDALNRCSLGADRPEIVQLGVPATSFLPHGSRDELLAECGLDAAGIFASVESSVRPRPDQLDRASVS